MGSARLGIAILGPTGSARGVATLVGTAVLALFAWGLHREGMCNVDVRFGADFVTASGSIESWRIHVTTAATDTISVTRVLPTCECVVIEALVPSRVNRHEGVEIGVTVDRSRAQPGVATGVVVFLDGASKAYYPIYLER